LQRCHVFDGFPQAGSRVPCPSPSSSPCRPCVHVTLGARAFAAEPECQNCVLLLLLILLLFLWPCLLCLVSQFGCGSSPPPPPSPELEEPWSEGSLQAPLRSGGGVGGRECSSASTLSLNLQSAAGLGRNPRSRAPATRAVGVGVVKNRAHWCLNHPLHCYCVLVFVVTICPEWPVCCCMLHVLHCLSQLASRVVRFVEGARQWPATFRSVHEQLPQTSLSPER
jgi:hypothetical protein